MPSWRIAFHILSKSYTFAGEWVAWWFGVLAPTVPCGDAWAVGSSLTATISTMEFDPPTTGDIVNCGIMYMTNCDIDMIPTK